MTISNKIIISSTLVALLAGLAPFIGLRDTETARNKLVKTLTFATEEIRILDNVKSQTAEIQSEILELVNDISNSKIITPNQYTEKEKAFDERISKLEAQIQAISKANPNSKNEANISSLLLHCESLGETLRNFFPTNHFPPKPGIALKAKSDADKIIGSFSKTILIAKNHQLSIIEQEGKLVETQFSSLYFWITIIGGLTFLLAISFGRIIANNLSTEINKLRNAANQLNEGDYSARVGLSSNDEFGKLGQTFDGMAANLEQSKVIEDQKVELERLNQALKTKNDSLDSFVYRVSHDLKAPVVNIRSLIKMIKLKTNENADLKQPFFFLDKSVNKLQQTIFDLLEVSRIEQSLEVTKSWINLEQMLSQVKSENSENIINGNVIITKDFQVPDLYFSQPNFESILSNIITNGIKYKSPNRRPEIHLSTIQKNDFVCLEIKDNGMGMDLEKHGKKLFGMFNRFHNHVEGSGVGLYIVKKIIEDAGGKIEVTSEVDKGTTFHIYLEQKNLPVESLV